jgi:hypothetical protein
MWSSNFFIKCQYCFPLNKGQDKSLLNYLKHEQYNYCKSRGTKLPINL